MRKGRDSKKCQQHATDSEFYCINEGKHMCPECWDEHSIDPKCKGHNAEAYLILKEELLKTVPVVEDVRSQVAATITITQKKLGDALVQIQSRERARDVCNKLREVMKEVQRMLLATANCPQMEAEIELTQVMNCKRRADTEREIQEYEELYSAFNTDKNYGLAIAFDNYGKFVAMKRTMETLLQSKQPDKHSIEVCEKANEAIKRKKDIFTKVEQLVAKFKQDLAQLFPAPNLITLALTFSYSVVDIVDCSLKLCGDQCNSSC